jgi:D-tyrosyl-tRNA(Tyr) deacylase
VSSASVEVNDLIISQIGPGSLLILGIEKEDGAQQIEKMARKVLNYRIFADNEGKMNKSLVDVKGELLVVSQFTLVADTSKGKRPGFSKGASPEHGAQIYQQFVDYIRTQYGQCQTGQFGANMKVVLVNDGPVTFWIET